MPSWTLIENLRGPKGNDGEPGPQGPPGAPLAIPQASPASTWTINHILGGRPDVVLISDEFPGERIYTDITYPDDSTIVVTWPTPTSGWAYIG